MQQHLSRRKGHIYRYGGEIRQAQFHYCGILLASPGKMKIWRFEELRKMLFVLEITPLLQIQHSTVAHHLPKLKTYKHI